MQNLQTGDLILFSGKGIFSSLIEWATGSKYSHCGIVLRDPTFLHPSLKGLFLWESGWEGRKDSENQQFKLGVQVVPLHESLANYDGKVYYRKLVCGLDETKDTVLYSIHKLVHDRPYDVNPFDWIEAWIQDDPDPQKTDRMFCSAFVALVYVKCGIFKGDIDWSIVRPVDLALNSDEMLNKGCYLEKVTKL